MAAASSLGAQEMSVLEILTGKGDHFPGLIPLIFAYLEAARRIDASRRHTMTFNWRSDPGLLHGVETLMTVLVYL